MRTIDLREGANHSLSNLSKGDILIAQNGDKYVLLSKLKHDLYFENGKVELIRPLYEARSYDHEWEEFYGFYYIFIEGNAVAQIDGVCMYNEMTGPI